MIRLHFPSVSVRLFHKPQKVLAFTFSQLRPLRRANSLETIVCLFFFYGPFWTFPVLHQLLFTG